ncbi:pyruvate carboxylase [Atopostipes suicloacalis DSM 15692]|uniref:Pyruvate carboxylase n=1 Tax=Atopostipes suicloacalis DSM 15692 TaxID=1121025 RepID=A0A1M4USY7_9LACT|nr:pyruvate carboxylase [Atopostipes suicloacalis]SHE59720.1 pyruvate carboxylase [Atopostipes suicloacalis DSM 15692]
MNQIQKVLVANRGEIAIRIMRACHELGIKTVGIYSKEDIGTLHRQKADESYIIGEGKSPTQAYLDIEGIIELAKEKNVDAIHPGYGFLSENEQFARRCKEEGILFIGPELKHLDMFGNKTRARETAIDAGLNVIPGTDGEISSVEDVLQFGHEYGYPIIIKAVSGGGGKGMRIVHNKGEVEEAYDRTKSEAVNSFGNDALYVEKYIDQPKHIEVQILGDQHGNVVHLYERDCSVQRRHQKVIEVAPAYALSNAMRKKLCDAALQLMKHVDYVNAGTVEFLVSGDTFYFIEVNPRVQVEHTITEKVTDIDIVKTQILIADGENLFGDTIRMPAQEDIRVNGYAIQSRITTEDPLNDFAPDTGKVIGYQSPGGPGLRLDAGNAFRGAVISPYYDSLLVKITASGSTIDETISKMERALDELKVAGVTTNISFLKNIIQHPKFYTGDYNTTFIQDYPELFDFVPPRDRGLKILKYIADVTVNGFPSIESKQKPKFETREVPSVKVTNKKIEVARKQTFKHLLDQEGPDAVSKAVLETSNALLTDTTLRDAHQSLLTTRLRTQDMVKLAPYMNETMKDYFSLELWGGATFDVAYNFLRESPWHRLEELRKLIPNIPFQMLLRASNAVGYKNYPDNVIKKFIQTSAETGIDVFRIFDSLNWLETMKLPIEEALKTGKIVEGTFCYTGDILNPERSEIYTLDYYVNLAKEIQAQGVHFLGIKDMSGILKPEAAYLLIKALKEEIDIPIHLHSHDTSGNALSMYSRAIDAGVDIVDTANAALAGQNAQPDANALYYTRQGTERTVEVDLKANDNMAEYWKPTRQYYAPFETDLKTSFTEVYNYEIPGGQYSNLRAQAKSLGLGNRFDEVLDMYRRVNLLFGDIVKVTPSSKIVGDMALFMVQNDLDEKDILEDGMKLDFPKSVLSFFQGQIGQPVGGMDKNLQKIVLKGRDFITDRPGNHIEPYDFEQAEEELEQFVPKRDIDDQVLLSYALYPKVYKDYLRFYEEYNKIQVIDTPSFFYGLEPNEKIMIEIEPGKSLLVELTSVGPLREGGFRTVYFDLNGLPQEIEVEDRNVEGTVMVRQKADKANPKQVGAQMPGTVVSISVKPGDQVKQNDTLIITEAMKMESAIQAPIEGIVKAVHVTEQEQVKGNDLLIEFE